MSSSISPKSSSLISKNAAQRPKSPIDRLAAKYASHPVEFRNDFFIHYQPGCLKGRAGRLGFENLTLEKAQELADSKPFSATAQALAEMEENLPYADPSLFSAAAPTNKAASQQAEPSYAQARQEEPSHAETSLAELSQAEPSQTELGQAETSEKTSLLDAKSAESTTYVLRRHSFTTAASSSSGSSSPVPPGGASELESV